MEQESASKYVNFSSKFNHLKNGCETAILSKYLSGNQAKKKPISISGQDSTVLNNLNKMMDLFQALLKDAIVNQWTFDDIPVELQSLASWEQGSKSDNGDLSSSDWQTNSNDPLASNEPKPLAITYTKDESRKTPTFIIQTGSIESNKKSTAKKNSAVSPWLCVAFTSPKVKPKGLLNEFSPDDYEYAKAWVANKLDTERNRYMQARVVETETSLNKSESEDVENKDSDLNDIPAIEGPNESEMNESESEKHENGDEENNSAEESDSKKKNSKKQRGEPKFPGRPRFSNEERLDIYTFYLQFRRLYMAERIWEFVNEKYSVPHSTLIRLVKDIEHRRSAARLKPRKTGPRKLSKEQVQQIVTEYETQMMSWQSLGEHPGVRPLARKYGVSRQTVLQILKEHNVKLITSKERRAMRLKAYGREYEPWAEKDRKWSKEIRELEAQRGFDRNSLNGVTLPKPPAPSKPRSKNNSSTPRKASAKKAAKQAPPPEPTPPMESHTQSSDLQDSQDPSNMSRSSCNIRSVQESFPSLSVEQLVGATYPHSSQSIVPHTSYLSNAFHANPSSSNHYTGNLGGNLQSNIYSQTFSNWSTGNVAQARQNRPQYSQTQY